MDRVSLTAARHMQGQRSIPTDVTASPEKRERNLVMAQHGMTAQAFPYVFFFFSLSFSLTHHMMNDCSPREWGCCPVHPSDLNATVHMAMHAHPPSVSSPP